MKGKIKNEVIDSFKDGLTERINSPFYGTFILVWVILHFRLIIVLFFVSEDKIWEATKLIKSDYILREFFNYFDLSFWGWLLLSLVITIITVWFLPKWILLPAFEVSENYEIEKKKIKIAGVKRIKIEEIGLEEKNIEKIATEIKRVEKEKEIELIDPTIAWLEDFLRSEATPVFQEFSYIVKSIYEYNGNIKIIDDSNFSPIIVFQIPPRILAYSHSNELLELNNTKEKIELTPKGKFFIKKFLESQPAKGE